MDFHFSRIQKRLIGEKAQYSAWTATPAATATSATAPATAAATATSAAAPATANASATATAAAAASNSNNNAAPVLTATAAFAGTVTADNHWVRPAEGTVKCNVDAALFDDNRFGIGLCIRDYQGLFVKAKTVWFYGSPPPQEAEALGLLTAVKWLQELHI